MERKFLSKNIFRLICVLTAFAMFGVLLYYGNQKQGFHMDELLTYGLSNNFYAPFPFETGEWLSSNYYHDYLTVNGDDAFAYGSVYYNQAADVHPPIYYIIFHTLSSLFQGTFTKWIGISANIIFYFLIIFIIFSFMKYLTEDKWIAYITAAFWGFSIGAVSSVMYIRMYVLLTLWFILFLFATTKLLDREAYSWRLLLPVFAITIGGVLTQYYFLIGAFFISFILCILLVLEKRWKHFFSFAGTMVAALGSSLLLFPPIIRHMFETARGKEAAENVVGESSYFMDYLQIVNRSLFASRGQWMLIALLLGFILAIFMKRRNLSEWVKRLVLIVVPALLYIGVIQKIAPYRTSRYIFSVYPAIVMGVFLTLYFIIQSFTKRTHLIQCAVLLYAMVGTYLAYQYEHVEYLYPEYASILETVEDYQNNDALVIKEANWKITGNILELKEFENVLPLNLEPTDVQLPDDTRLLENERLVVLIDKAFDQDLTLDLIRQKYDYNEVTLLYDHNATLAYYLTN